MKIEQADTASPPSVAPAARPGLRLDGVPEQRVALSFGEVNYVSRGSGAPVVLLHGGYGSWQHWYANIEPLSAHARVIALDMPGFGLSSSLPGTLSADSLADAVAEAVQAILAPEAGGGAEQAFHILAFSFGTTVAANLALRYPRRIRAMLLLSPPGVNQIPQELLDIQARASELARTDGLMAGVRMTAEDFMLKNASLIDDTVLNIIAHGVQHCRVRQSREISRATPMLDMLARSQAPARLLFGEDDPFYRARMDDYLLPARRALGQAGAEVVRQCAHWVQYEQPGVVLREARAHFGWEA